MTSLAPNDFSHLHVHSEFSLLDGLGRINELLDQAAAHGFDSLALTDHGALYGAVAFYQAAAARQIKPILGVETYIARRSMTDREGKADAQPYHLVLLAKDWQGYLNLCRLVTDAHVDGYYYKPRIDREYLAQHAEGLIGLSACLNGEIARALEVDDWQLATTLAGEYSDILGQDNFFLELQDHGLPEQRAVLPRQVALARELGVPVVATNDLLVGGEVLLPLDRFFSAVRTFLFQRGIDRPSAIDQRAIAIENGELVHRRCGLLGAPRARRPSEAQSWAGPI